MDRSSSTSASLQRSLTTSASIATYRSCSLAVALESMTDIITATRQLSTELVSAPDIEQLKVCSIWQFGPTVSQLLHATRKPSQWNG